MTTATTTPVPPDRAVSSSSMRPAAPLPALSSGPRPTQRFLAGVEGAYSSVTGIQSLARSALFMGPAPSEREAHQLRTQLRERLAKRAHQNDWTHRTAEMSGAVGTTASVASFGNTVTKNVLHFFQLTTAAGVCGSTVAPILGLVTSPATVITESLRMASQSVILARAHRVLKSLDLSPSNPTQALVAFMRLVGQPGKERATRLKQYTLALCPLEAEALMLIAEAIDELVKELKTLSVDQTARLDECQTDLVDLIGKGAALAQLSARKHRRSSFLKVCLNLLITGLLIALLASPVGAGVAGALTLCLLLLSVIGACITVRDMIRGRSLNLHRVLPLESPQSPRTAENPALEPAPEDWIESHLSDQQRAQLHSLLQKGLQSA